MANALSNLAKRQVAFSGRVGTGDVPELYALRDAMAREGAAQMGGTPSLGAGEGAGAPIPTAAGGTGAGGAVGGAADLALPGQGFANPEIERIYTRAFRSVEDQGGEAPDRGEIASRGMSNIDPADPYGVGFGTGLSNVTQAAQYLGIPFAPMANTFVNLMLKDAQLRNDQFFDSLIQGTAPIDYSSGVAITRDPGAPMEFEAALLGDDLTVQPDSGVTISRRSRSGQVPGDFDDSGFSGFTGRSGDYGVGSGSSFGADLATGNVDVDTSSGVSIGRGGDGGGDAGSGGGGGGGDSGGMGCFVAGTSVLMSDGTEKPIEDIELGDKVIAFDADSGETDAREVTSLFAHAAEPIWVVNDRTYCTPGHRFFAKFGKNGWGFWPLNEIPIGARLMDAQGNEVVAETIQDGGRRATVHNITVQGLHTYIADGYRVHNIKHKGGYISEDRVPGVRRGDVDEILQEGEYVITADAVEKFGPEFFDTINTIARLAKKGRK